MATQETKVTAKRTGVVKLDAKKLAPIAKRQASLTAKAKAQAKAKERQKVAREKAAKVAAERSVNAQVKYLRTIQKAASPKTAKLHTLRERYFATKDLSDKASHTYAAAITAKFGIECWKWTKAEGKPDTNHGKTVREYLAEKTVFYENFKAQHVAQGKLGDANPSVYWGNFAKYAAQQANVGKPDTSRVGSGNKLDALAAFKRDLPALYLRANNTKGFDKNPTLQKVAELSAEILKLVGANLGEINLKIGQ